jgi:nucleoid DNA-binding protein
VKRKSEIDTDIAQEMGLSKKLVSRITGVFIQHVRQALIDDGTVRLDRLGKLRVVHYKGTTRKLTDFNRLLGKTRIVEVPAQVRVHFSKSRSFRDALLEQWSGDMGNEEEGMDKYGVDEGAPNQEQLEKRAAQGCPEDGCGKKPTRHGSILICPTHGSEPFESGG